jgi:hypothetical protein
MRRPPGARGIAFAATLVACAARAGRYREPVAPVAETIRAPGRTRPQPPLALTIELAYETLTIAAA